MTHRELIRAVRARFEELKLLALEQLVKEFRDRFALNTCIEIEVKTATQFRMGKPGKSHPKSTFTEEEEWDIAYDWANGMCSQIDVARASGITQPAISYMVKKWGISRINARRPGRPKKL